MNAEQINIGVDSDGEAKIVIGGQQIHLGLDSDDSGEDGAAPLFSKDAALCGRLMSFPVMAPSSSLLPKCEDPGSEEESTKRTAAAKRTAARRTKVASAQKKTNQYLHSKGKGNLRLSWICNS